MNSEYYFTKSAHIHSVLMKSAGNPAPIMRAVAGGADDVIRGGKVTRLNTHRGAPATQPGAPATGSNLATRGAAAPAKGNLLNRGWNWIKQNPWKAGLFTAIPMAGAAYGTYKYFTSPDDVPETPKKFNYNVGGSVYNQRMQFQQQQQQMQDQQQAYSNYY